MAKAASKTKPDEKHGTRSPPSRQKAPLPGATPASVLPKTIINALPTGAAIAKHITAIEALLPQLEKELAAAVKAGPVQIARAFVVLHRLNDRMLSEEKAFKPYKNFYGITKAVTVPACFEQAGVPNVSLSEGFRVGVTDPQIRASVKPGCKAAAFTWLEEHGVGDLIQPTLNASTLSAFAKQLGEKNEELPDDVFNVARIPTTSVTKL